MAAITYPGSLPCPQLAQYEAVDRRLTQGRPAVARTGQRDRLATLQVTFPPFTPSQAEAFLAWWDGTLFRGGAWFAADWPVPQGVVTGVFKFIGSPTWQVVKARGGDMRRVSALVEVRGRSALPQESPINIDIDANANAGVSSSVGVLVEGLDPASTYEVTQPADRVYGGFSLWPSDDSVLLPLVPPDEKWGNGFVVTAGPGPAVDEDEARSTVYGEWTGYPNAAAARLAYAPVTLTGSAEYRFWLIDPNTGDNRGGLSLELRRL